MISTRQLVDFCRRGATSFRAGLDVRQIMQRETTIGPGVQRRKMAAISRRVEAGDALAAAMADQHYFPSLAVEMIDVGEQTGKLERVLAQLAEHYANILSLRRTFIAGLTWPLIQLGITVFVVGFLIWIVGLIGAMPGGQTIDILGLGLVGTPGLLAYLAIIGMIAGIAALALFLFNRGWLWTGALMHLLIRVPMIGPCLKYFALSRVAWALSMAIDAGMDVTTSLKLALRASQNVYFSGAWPAVEAAIGRRIPMADALRASGRFPEEFLMNLETGELSGMVSETLARHAEDLRERAQVLLRTITVLAGTLCSFVVMGMIVLVILRLAMFYIGTIYDALEMFP